MPHEQPPHATGHAPAVSFSRYAARFSRRTFLGGLGGTISLSLIGCNAPWQTPAPVSPVQPPPSGYIAYHNSSTAYHQQQIARLSSQGYRPISLSLYGDPTQPLYAAVWLKSNSNAWYTFHSVSAEDYQQLFTTWTLRGYRPTILTATGSQAKAIFADVFEQDATPFLVKYHLTTTLQDNIAEHLHAAWPRPPTARTIPSLAACSWGSALPRQIPFYRAERL